MTLKYHKSDFLSKPDTRLINSSNSDIGQISEKIVEEIKKTIRKTNYFNQWTSNRQVLEWYKNLEKTNTNY